MPWCLPRLFSYTDSFLSAIIYEIIGKGISYILSMWLISAKLFFALFSILFDTRIGEVNLLSNKLFQTLPLLFKGIVKPNGTLTLMGGNYEFIPK